MRVTFESLFFARESHSAFAMTEPGTPHLGTPSPERPTASVSTSDSNSLRRSVERLFKRPMAAKGGGASTSTASVATGNTSKSASKQPVVSTEIAASPDLRRETTARPLSKRGLAPSPLSHDARYETDERTMQSGQDGDHLMLMRYYLQLGHQPRPLWIPREPDSDTSAT